MGEKLFNMFERAVMNDMHQLTPKILLDLCQGFTDRQYFLIDLIERMEIE